ncbi:MAG: hypothetical protein JO218_14995 [Burkholderiales bacterium]|nr:hypothetical protein [Burkholderiales bacterium]
MRKILAPLVLSSLLGGCAESPSINVLGAFFPDWLFCIVGGIAVATVLHRLLAVDAVAERIGRTTVPWLSPIVAVLAALVAWLTFFQN